MWPFRKNPKSTAPCDMREWNEDWKAGDTAECIVDGITWRWAESVKPWERPAFGQRLTVTGFYEGPGKDGAIYYFLKLEGWPRKLPTQGFRKVRPVASEKSEIVERILNAEPGADRKRRASTKVKS